jgi:phosphoglucomutase
VWTTDKDGIILSLLAAEITARTGRDPGEIYDQMTHELGLSYYERIDAGATPEQLKVLKSLTPSYHVVKELAGEPVTAVLSTAPGNNAPIGGIKVIARSGWFAARPSGTEEVYKIYAESFRDIEHLRRIQQEAQAQISEAFKRIV